MQDLQSEIRQNLVTNEWVVYAPSRSDRQVDYKQKNLKPTHQASYDPECPFCPGQEDMLPDIVGEVAFKSEDGSQDSSKWQVRLVPNKYPAFFPTNGKKQKINQIYHSVPGVGVHDILIEHPKHNLTWTDMKVEEVELIINTYRSRLKKIESQPEHLWNVIFRNFGREAGSSLIHPHSQIISSASIPDHVQKLIASAERYYFENERCVYCEMLDYEINAKRRVILDNTLFTTFVPYAAEYPFEVWIMPKNHRASFSKVEDVEVTMLANTVKSQLKIMKNVLGEMPYNLVLITWPRHLGALALHWYIKIIPRTSVQGGFEFASGANINPSTPEKDAAILRDKTMQKALLANGQ